MYSKLFLVICLFLFSFSQVNAVLKDKISPRGKVMLIRHAEKPASGNDLSTMGWRRAACIKDLFINGRPDLTPKKIYAQKASKKDETIPDSRRQIETVAPLARELDYTIDNSYNSFEVDAMCQDIGTLSEPDFPVLISWNHDDIKTFLINFGMKYQIAPTYPSKRYDIIFTIERDANNEVVFQSFSENCTGLGDYRFSDARAFATTSWFKMTICAIMTSLLIYLF